AELPFEPGLRLAVAQDQRMRVADGCGDPSDFRRLQRTLRQQIEHPVERAVGAVAGRVFLDAEALLQDMPFLSESGRGAVAVGLSVGRVRRPKALRVPGRNR